MISRRMLVIVVVGFLAAILINFRVLPGNHIVSSLYLLPVLVACHSWRPRLVAATAVVASALYLVSALIENRPLAVWPFGLLGMLIGGYLAVRFASQREQIGRLAPREADDRVRFQMFIGMVAHDLAGAMSNVRAGMEMLSWQGYRTESDEERVATRAINGGVHQIERLLDDLRDASAIGSDRFTIRPVTMDLIEVVRQIVDRQSVTSQRHRLMLDAPARLMGSWDRDRIDQLLGNLVSNACKYSPDGGVVTVRVAAAAGGVTMSVRDEGAGIDPGQLGRIFEPFVRLEEHDDLPGTGLGLWIARAIVDAHGGRTLVAMLVTTSAYMVHGIFPVLATEYGGLTAAETGLIYTISAAAFLVAGPTFGWLVDRRGSSLGVAWRAIANIGSSVLYLVSPSFGGIAIARVVDDSGKAAFRPAWAVTASRVAAADPARRGSRLGALDSAQGIGEVVGPLLAGLLWQTGGIYLLFGVRIGIAAVAEIAALRVFRHGGSVDRPTAGSTPEEGVPSKAGD